MTFDTHPKQHCQGSDLISSPTLKASTYLEQCSARPVWRPSVPSVGGSGASLRQSCMAVEIDNAQRESYSNILHCHVAPPQTASRHGPWQTRLTDSGSTTVAEILVTQINSLQAQTSVHWTPLRVLMGIVY